jgi:hypothetical protein
VSMGTVEELMLSLHERKRALVSAVLSGKARPGTPKTEELMALLASPHSTTPARP